MALAFLLLQISFTKRFWGLLNQAEVENKKKTKTKLRGWQQWRVCHQMPPTFSMTAAERQQPAVKKKKKRQQENILSTHGSKTDETNKMDRGGDIFFPPRITGRKSKNRGVDASPFPVPDEAHLHHDSLHLVELPAAGLKPPTSEQVKRRPVHPVRPSVEKQLLSAQWAALVSRRHRFLNFISIFPTGLRTKLQLLQLFDSVELEDIIRKIKCIHRNHQHPITLDCTALKFHFSRIHQTGTWCVF